MSVIPLKIAIADRDYTLRVSADDAPLLKRAAQMLNERLSEKREQMRIVDRQDLLAMVAFDSMFEELLQNERKEALAERLIALNESMQTGAHAPLSE
jgi:cell division protein ZapA